jgi:hypothetical protein
MLLELDTQASTFVLGAIRAVCTGGEAVPLSQPGATAIAAFGAHGLGLSEPIDMSAPAPTPAALGEAMPSSHAAALVADALCVSALADGTLDEARISTVVTYVDVLDADAGWLEDLEASTQPDLGPVIADMGGKNLSSVTDGRVDFSKVDDVSSWLLPYEGDGVDPMLAERYRSLGALPEGTFGRHFFDFYDGHGFAMPGEPGAVNEMFGTPHDCTHLLSGYDTTPQGELLVSTFTSQMHPVFPMEGHVLPVIYSWHLGIEFNKLAGSYRGALDLEKFWVAWERGQKTQADTFSSAFDFWSHVEDPLSKVADAFSVPPLHPRFEAHSDAVAGVDYHPIA